MGLAAGTLEQPAEVQFSFQRMALLSEINQPFGRALENQRSNKVTKALAEIVQQQKRNGPQLQTDEAAENLTTWKYSRFKLRDGPKWIMYEANQITRIL